MNPRRIERAYVYVAVFVCGAVGMALEIIGSRVLTPDFGSTIFVWGSLISVFLAALCVGYSIGGRLSERGRSTAVLTWLTAAPGVLLVAFPLYGFRISAFIFELNVGDRLGPLLASLCLFFLPTVFFGTISPYGIGLLARSHEGAGRSAGDIFALSTVGSIVGTLGTSFYLILWMGTRASLILLGSILLALAAAGLVLRLCTRP